MPKRSSLATWEYDTEADVLYLSFGDPRPAVDVEIGDGLVLRYDEARQEVAGLTVIGLREWLSRGLDSGGPDESPVQEPGRTAARTRDAPR